MHGRLILAAAMLGFSLLWISSQSVQASDPQSARAQDPLQGMRFSAVCLDLDVEDAGFAAYQVEIHISSGEARLVGIEGGTAAGFTAPPFHDPRALSGKHVIIAAFSPGSSLPVGRHRVAVIHVLETEPPPVYRVESLVAGDSDARPVQVTATLVPECRPPTHKENS
jgi:flavin-binding protein dodecin